MICPNLIALAFQIPIFSPIQFVLLVDLKFYGVTPLMTYMNYHMLPRYKPTEVRNNCNI